MDAFRRCCALVLLFASANALAAADVGTHVMEELEALAGDDARDCGPIRLDGARNEAVACAEQAAAAGQAYRVAFERQGIDSEIREGAARDGSGKPWAIHYDSDVTGGSETPDPWLIIASCRAVSFSAQGQPVVTCLDPVVQP
jgi:hypothetical protein